MASFVQMSSTRDKAVEEDRVQLVADDEHRAGLGGEADTLPTLQKFIGRQYRSARVTGREYAVRLHAEIRDLAGGAFGLGRIGILPEQSEVGFVSVRSTADISRLFEGFLSHSAASA